MCKIEKCRFKLPLTAVDKVKGYQIAKGTAEAQKNSFPNVLYVCIRRTTKIGYTENLISTVGFS